MGNMVTTCCGRFPNKSRLHSDYDLVPHIKGHKRDLSATYSAKDLAFTFNQLNVNTATEEELMTLPGVSRPVARNIVDYRRQIGGFRKVEDIALVTGVGAVKLAHMRNEICVNNRNGTPHGSEGGISRNSSVLETSQSAQYVDVNTATVAQLSKINGLGEHFAKKIIHHRNTNGLFYKYDEIADIPGVGQATLIKILDQITLGKMEYSNSRSDIGSNGHVPKRRLYRSNSKSSGTQTDFLAPTPTTPPSGSSYIRDPVVEFTGVKDGLPIIRVGSWNMSKLSKEKASNSGVMEVICFTILENGCGFEVPSIVCTELNNPTLPNIVGWTGHQGQWECEVSDVAGRINQSLEYNGFLWDKSRGITLKDARLLQQVQKQAHQQFVWQPYIGLFQAAKLDITLVSVHLNSKESQDHRRDKEVSDVKKLPYLIESLQTEVQGQSNIMIVGDFHTEPTVSEFDILKNLGFTNSIAATLFTNISRTDLDGSCCHDNMWISKELQDVKTGETGVIRSGLQHPCIPDGWNWNSVVSNHCPVWTELYVNKTFDGNTDSEIHYADSATASESGASTSNHIRHASYKASFDVDGNDGDLDYVPAV
uniref:Endonuclease/exonuclease/phosphatase family domain-containing protein 1 n=1 Tax=Saccoglossus kowalevskii TaxID=10224 RepID=A0ABM0MAB3_SACKO|nr:PREDICTED: endonuclease/exonuclease/phosphatase family domain-containing protein 1-like [Saccoglossus kowalevskii]